MSYLYRELRRRQVFGVVALYAVVAWAIIEVGDMAINSGIVAGLTTGNLFMLALIGFPLVLITGWFYNVTRHGIYRTASADAADSFDRKLQIRDYGFMLALLAIWTGTYVYIHTPAPAEKSIAVMPFENRGNDPENAQFAFGIHDDLMTQLQRIGDLKLIATPSVRAIDPEMPLQQAGLRLGAAFIMKGSVERVLDRIRVNVVLLDAARDQQTWSGSFDRELSAINLFDIRDEITRAITGQLQAALSAEERSRVFDLPTTSLEASSHYARGRQLMANQRSHELMRAIEEFEEAVRIDPQFALAWAGMADAALLANHLGAMGMKASDEMRNLAANRAMALNDQLGEAWVAYGDLMALEGAAQGEIWAAFEKAIELSPNYAQAYHRYSLHLPRSNLAEAKHRLALWQMAMQLDPMTPVYQINAAIELTALGREKEAQNLRMRLLESFPQFWATYFDIAQFHRDSGRIIEAIDWTRRGLQVDPANADMLYALAMFHVRVEAWDGVARIRQVMIERLDPGDHRVPLLDWQVFRRQLDWQAALELLAGLPEFFREMPFVQFATGLIHFESGDMHEARRHWSGLEVNEGSFWVGSVGGDCEYVQVMIETGDPELGREMLAEALHYFETILPALPISSGHRDLDGRQGICYLLDDRADEALAFYERRLELGHGHVHDWWKYRLNPLWDPYRDDPRITAIDRRVESTIREQREILDDLDQSEGVIR